MTSFYICNVQGQNSFFEIVVRDQKQSEIRQKMAMFGQNRYVLTFSGLKTKFDPSLEKS